MKTARVYGLQDSSGHTRYVGVTAGSLRRRLTTLTSVAYRGASQQCAQWIRELSYEPIIVLLEEVPYDTRFVAEQRWISRLRAGGCSLLNMTSGGLGRLDGVQSAIERDKRSTTLQGHTVSDATRRLIGLANSRPWGPAHEASRIQATQTVVYCHCGRPCRGTRGLGIHRAKAHSSSEALS